jgi:hypothetical protein
MMRLKTLVLTLPLVTACAHGMRPQVFPPAQRADGAPVTYRLVGSSTQLRAELFAVEDSSVIVRRDKLERLHWSRLAYFGVNRMGARYQVMPSSPIDPDKRERLRLVSRFPQGLSGPLLERVLDALQQPTLDSLADLTASRIARYADRNVAVAEGYRRIGTDFPGMGEHWLHPAALFAQRVDPERPTMLAYAEVNGRPTLLGAGYVITTRGNEPAPVPGWPAYWHEHSGALDDESGARVGVRDVAPDATHVWVLHIWSALPNPASRYDADNWALPFARLGIAPPADVDHDMGRALSLAVAGGDRYLRGVLEGAGLLEAHTLPQVDSAIAETRAVSERVVGTARARGALSAEEGETLRHAWHSLSARLRSALGPAVGPILAPLHAHQAVSAAR